MKSVWRKLTERYGYPKVCISIFIVVLLIIAVFQDQSIYSLLRDSMVRVGMNSILVLAMVPSIISGTGLNFALSIGMVCGVLAGCISIEMNMVGMPAFITAALISIPMSVLAGYL